ncbi:MAG: magnesium and cobalt exporter, family [Actinomycetota bacterium]|jgi:CBS domain containing-hemolysin-like protein|nr:magnesium and cobalt exporter, family [Actinomycetota bacterium]
MSTDLIMVLVVVALIGLAAILAMAETALTRTNRIRALTLAEEGKKGANSLLKLVEHPERFLNPLLLLLLLCHLGAASIVSLLAEQWAGALGVALGILFEVVVIFVLAEAIPKTFAVQHPDRAALRVAPFVSAIIKFPLVRLLSWVLIGLANVLVPGKGLKTGPFVSESELLATVDVATEGEVIEREERRLIHSIIEFGDTVVREVMVPRPDMVAVEARASVEDALEVALAAGYSRIPVYEQGIDDIVGVLYTKDLIRASHDGKGDEPVRELVRPANFVPETKRVAELLPEMQKQKQHMAIVVDEHGGVAGLVTLEDLIEELVGEIVDEYDVEEAQVEDLGGGEFRVNARMPTDELEDLIHVALPEGGYDTVGGLLLDLLGHVPAEGESVDFDGHRLTAENVQGRRIGRVRITPLHPASAPASASPSADGDGARSDEG